MEAAEGRLRRVLTLVEKKESVSLEAVFGVLDEVRPRASPSFPRLQDCCFALPLSGVTPKWPLHHIIWKAETRGRGIFRRDSSCLRRLRNHNDMLTPYNLQL